MKKQYLFILVTIFSVKSYSQIFFESGYFIDNTNQKVNCLIKNIDWRNNPTEFEYKLSEISNPEKATIKSVKEFGINNISKYQRNTVNIDRSDEGIKNLSDDKKPIFKEEELFLKVLVEGHASLYLYEDGNLMRFFYTKDNASIEQLVYKSYKVSESEISKNNTFKNQLWNDLKCATFKISKVENLDYEKLDLINFFVEYNACNNQDYINYEEKQERNSFNLNLRPGLNSSSLSLQNSSREINFDNKIAFRFGIEAEYIMPFNKNKWALIIEPTYQYFNSETELTGRNVKVDYESVELQIGMRHNFFLNENSKIFINGSFITDVVIKPLIDFPYSDDLEIKSRYNSAFGIGYKKNDKYSLELRYQTGREILSNYIYWNSHYNTLSVIFGYSLF